MPLARPAHRRSLHRPQRPIRWLHLWTASARVSSFACLAALGIVGTTMPELGRYTLNDSDADQRK